VFWKVFLFSQSLILKINVAPFFKKLKVVQKLGQAGYNLLLKVSAPPENLQKFDNKKAGYHPAYLL